MSVCENVCWYTKIVQCLQRPAESTGSPRTGVPPGSYEVPCGCWELDKGPLKEQPVLPAADHLPIPTTLFLYVIFNSFLNRH